MFDEFPTLVRIPYLEELLAEGRSRGVCVVLGFQHVAHVRQLYRELTEALLGQCYHHACFRANDKEMSLWVSERFAPLYDRDREKPWQTKETPSVTRGETMDLNAASERAGFQCIIKTEREVVNGPRRIHVTPSMGPPKLRPVERGDDRRAGFVPRSRQGLVLTAWTAAE